jgi:hypothetical protein
MHGAPKDVDPASAALGYRDAAFNVSAMASWTDPAHYEESIAWARETAAAIEPWSFSGGYANYMQADEPLDRVRATFGPESFARLQALKFPLRPGQRPAPEPEHSAGGVGSRCVDALAAKWCPLSSSMH